jgi:hypothetical protein
MNLRLLVGLATLIGLPIMELAWGGPHIHYDDAGNINWRPTYPAAMSIAQKSVRPVFLQISKDKDKASEDQVAVAFRDEKLGQFVNRYFVPVAVDFDKPPTEVKPFIANLGKKPMAPVIIIVTEKGQPTQTFTGTWQPDQLQGKLIEVLENKGYVLPKSKEAEVSRQVDALEKTLAQGAKAWPKATQMFRTIQAYPGYSPLKDKAYDAIDKAQEGGSNSLKEAYNHTRQDEYADAKKLVEKVIKEYAGAPVGDQAKEHLAAVKLMETANQLANDSKKKATAVLQLDQVLTKYGDTPYSGLALSRKRDLVPAKTK